MYVKIILGDCLQKLPEIFNESIDLILTDPPYGITNNQWDSIIPFEPMWNQLNRITKNNSPILLFGTEPFSSYLRLSNIKNFKYDWIWNKVTGVGFQIAKSRPLQSHEIISVFSKKPGKINYYPIMIERSKIKHSKMYAKSNVCNLKYNDGKIRIYTHLYPKSIITVSNASKKNILHPTQKPIELLEYLIKTYTKENDTILDFTAGSFSTAIAAINTNRNFIGIENDLEYFNKAIDRINNHIKLLQCIHTINFEIIQ